MGLFSLPKILFTIAIIGAVWYGFRWFQARQGQVDDVRRGQKPVNKGAAASDTEDMVECATCGTYVVASGAKSCGKPGCPYPG